MFNIYYIYNRIKYSQIYYRIEYMQSNWIYYFILYILYIENIEYNIRFNRIHSISEKYILNRKKYIL